MKRGIKIDTVFWIAILGLLLTSIYTGVLIKQGSKTMRMIEFIYYRNKMNAERETAIGNEVTRKDNS